MGIESDFTNEKEQGCRGASRRSFVIPAQMATEGAGPFAGHGFNGAALA